ncbi:MAG: ATP-binding cassette domain-containing protein [Candidatus Limivicinus sp.]
MNSDILSLTIEQAYKTYPFLDDFFLSCAIESPAKTDMRSLGQWIEELEYFTLDEVGFDRDELPGLLERFIFQMLERLSGEKLNVESITIMCGRDKDGNPEVPELTLKKGDVVSIVGATGSGKSRLLSDIEWLAQGDTPTKRKILINGQVPPQSLRFSIDKKLVAQLSQTMNFVMDITVEKFLHIHCDSHMIKDKDSKTEEILWSANLLSGEPLKMNMPVTSLSGGQSRALMIADTACISTAPIVVIDEIENAGINRKNAIDLLLKAEKIVLMATHDPVLALQADRRIVIKNGGIQKVVKTTDGERAVLAELERMNEKIMQCRERMRNGDLVESI